MKMKNNKSVCVLIASVLVWFYGPRLAYIFEWSFGSSLELIGATLMVAGGLYLIFIKLPTESKRKTEK